MRQIVRRIGLDLDNTIVDYSELIRSEVAALGVLDAVPAGDKRAMRDVLRGAPDGEAHWIRVQARIYGARMDGAVAFPGALHFIALARAAGIELSIVSHKTEFAAGDAGQKTSLHAAARRWLAASGVVGLYAVPEEAVYFEATRSAKTARISALRPDVFIDDLVEVFEDPGFPEGVGRWLFAPEPDTSEIGRSKSVDRTFSSWDELSRAVFEAVGEAAISDGA